MKRLLVAALLLGACSGGSESTDVTVISVEDMESAIAELYNDEDRAAVSMYQSLRAVVGVTPTEFEAAHFMRDSCERAIAVDGDSVLYMEELEAAGVSRDARNAHVHSLTLASENDLCPTERGSSAARDVVADLNG